MSDPVPVISEIRRIKNVKISTLHAKAERYRDGFVKLFREHEFAYVIDEDGSLLLDGAGRRVSVTASWFAREMGPHRRHAAPSLAVVPQPCGTGDGWRAAFHAYRAGPCTAAAPVNPPVTETAPHPSLTQRV